MCACRLPLACVANVCGHVYACIDFMPCHAVPHHALPCPAVPCDADRAMAQAALDDDEGAAMGTFVVHDTVR